MRRMTFAICAGVCVAAAGASAQAQERTIGAPIAMLRGAIWADKNNDGYVDGYVYSGQYYPGTPPGYEAASQPEPAHDRQAAFAGGESQPAQAHPAPAKEIVAPDSVTGFRDSHLTVTGDETRFGFTKLVPGQPYTVVLLACAPAPDFAMSAARPIALNQPRPGYYLSTLSLQTNKTDVWYRLRAARKEDVGEPFTIALIKGPSASEADLEALRPVCPAPALTPQEIRRRWGQLADMDHKSLVFTNGKEVFDFDWIVPGKSMIQYRRNYGDKYANSAGHLLSWDERRQQIHSQYISAGVVDDEYFTPGIKVANIIPYEDDRRAAKLARANDGGGGGGFGGFLKGALAGAAGMAMGASPETATESMIAGAVAGGMLGANGEDPGMIGAAAAQGSAQGTAEVEASNAELRRISERAIRTASAGGGGSSSTSGGGTADETAPSEARSGTGAGAATTTKSARAHYSLNLRLTDQSTRNPVCFSRDFTLQFPSTGDRNEDYKTIYALMEAKAGRFKELCTRTRQAALDPPSWAVEGYTSYAEPDPHLEPGNDIVVDAP